MTEGIRLAASAIVVREGAHGPEVLVLERAQGNRFLPGYVVFPGGAVDAGDEDLAGRWFGDRGLAPRAAAVRELAEEVGLLLTSSGLQAALGHDPLERISAAPPDVRALEEVAHWVAPVDVPVRFDARYYAVLTTGAAEPVADGREAAAAWWAPPPRLMQEWEAGTRRLYWPTYFTMAQLAACGTVEAILGSRLQTREPTDDEVDALPRSVFWET